MSAFLSVPISLGYVSTGLFSMGLIQDVILMIISGLACLYCVILNRRVKSLSNMKSGLGASIVSLTDAIRQTQNAAKDTEVTTLKAIHSLQNLMDEAESTISKLEARKIDLDRQVSRAAKLADLQSQLVQRIEVDLPKAISGADKTLTKLKTAVTDVQALDRNSPYALTSTTTATPIVNPESNNKDQTPQPAAKTVNAKAVKKAANKSPTSKRSKKTSATLKPATRSKAQAKTQAKKVTPMKKSKSRDIVNLSPNSAEPGSVSNKKMAS